MKRLVKFLYYMLWFAVGSVHMCLLWLIVATILHWLGWIPLRNTIPYVPGLMR